MKKAKKNTSNNNELLTPGEVQYPDQHLEGRYGFHGYSPDWLQYCNNPTSFLVVISFFFVIYGAFSNGIFSVIITTLEKRFGFNSSESGFIAVCYDISYFVVCLFITFHANRGHRMRLLAVGSILYGLGIFLFAVPHFTTGLYQYGKAESPFCDANRTLECRETETSDDLHSYYYLFIFAMLLQGIGGVPLCTVTLAIFEDSLPKKKTPIYIGIANAVALFGPVVGYTAGGYLLSIYVDFDDPSSTGNDDLDKQDPRWVGAWWIGCLATSLICFVFVTIPMFGFPRRFPGSAKLRAIRKPEVQAQSGQEIACREDFGKSIKDMPAAIWMLLKNPTYMFTTLASCALGHVIAGYAFFLPKIIENQYHTTATHAALFTGATSLPGGVIGCIASGIIVSKLNLETRGLLKFSMACAFFLTLTAPISLYYCPNSLVAGVTTSYVESDLGRLHTNLTSFCNDGCNCQQKYFKPVCANSVNYFSACHAGCGDFNSSSQRFSNCDCLINGTKTATKGMCEDTCNALLPYIVVMFLVVMICFAALTPSELVLLRCVPDSQKALAMGLQIFFLRAIGSIPGPLVFGAVFDVSCILWQENGCEEGRGSCFMYNSDQLAISLTIISLTTEVLSFALFYLALKFYKPAIEEKTPPLNDPKTRDEGNEANDAGINEDARTTFL